jgi:hypothetical protein
MFSMCLSVRMEGRRLSSESEQMEQKVASEDT